MMTDDMTDDNAQNCSKLEIERRKLYRSNTKVIKKITIGLTIDGFLFFPSRVIPPQ
jgi:hypothetical protein